MIRFKPSLKTMMRLNGATLWIGQLSLTTGRTCLESNGFMLGKIAGAFNSHDNQDSKIKQPKYEVIRLVVVELNSLYLLDSHHSNIQLLGFTLLTPRSEVLHQWQRLVIIFFYFFLL